VQADADRWQQLSAELDALLDLEPDARAHALDAIAARDAALAQELRALLAAESGEGLLERGVVAAAPELISALASRTEPVEEAVGRLIGHWRVLRALGRGGMGEVLLAERADGDFAQQAAIKRLKRGMDSDEVLRRFAQERRILAGLNHPQIARLLDGGLDADGRPYFAMEYVEGEPITDYARRRELGVRERLQLMQQVCEAVAYAQSRLVVHRDLKPSNILVDTRGEPKLLDFGIAKLLADSSDAHLTGTGLRVLSPAYAAPEQILGETISTATDVYALGLLLYELLTGQLPHRRDQRVVGASAETLARETTERPSAALRAETLEIAKRAWGARAGERERLAREIGGDLDRIVLTALRREPERRYASAAALADDLRLFLDGRPISARPDTSGYRLRKFLRRHQVGAVATVLVLLSLLVGAGVALWQAQVARGLAAEAATQRERAEAQALRAERTKAFVVSLFEATNPEQARRGAQLTALELVRDAAKRIEEELDDAPETQAELRLALGQSLAALGAIDEGLPKMEAGLAELRRGGAAETAIAEALHGVAMQYLVVGRMEEAQRATTESLALFEKHRATHALDLIGARTTLAKLAGTRGDLETMESLYQQILVERRALLGPDHPRLAVDWNNLAATALRLDRYAEAERAIEEAMRVMALDPQAPESRQAWLRAGRAVALFGLGDYVRSQDELEAAMEIAERTLHAEHPIVGAICNALSALARHRGRWDEAALQAERAVAVYAKTNHPDQGIAEMHLGLARLGQGRDADALAVLEAAEQHLAQRRNREEPQYWQTQAALGLAQLRNDDTTGDARVRDALHALGQRQRVDSAVHAEALGLAAEVAALQRDATRERELRTRERDMLSTVLGVTHPRTRAAQLRLDRSNAPASR
jgi:eukaryotic-like serine/threonine-protein kinase